MYIWSRNVQSYKIINVSRFIWHAVVRGKISQSRNLVNSSAQGSEQKVNNKIWRVVFRWMLKEDESLNCTGRWKTMNYSQVNNFRLLPPASSTSASPYFVFKNDRYRTRPSSDNLQIDAPNSNVSQKSTRSSVHQSRFMLLYVLFISFPVRHTGNFRFDGRHWVGDLMALTMVWKLLYSECDR